MVLGHGHENGTPYKASDRKIITNGSFRVTLFHRNESLGPRFLLKALNGKRRRYFTRQ